MGKPKSYQVRSSRLRRPLLIVFVVLATLLPVSRALGDPFDTGPPDGGWKADSKYHTYCYGAGLDAVLRDDVDYVMQWSLDAETDMKDVFESTCNPNGTDAQFFDANLPGGVRGQYVCVSRSIYCWAAELTVDPAQINIGSNDTEDLRKTLCHEVGHSVGLTHHDPPYDDCMINGEIPDTSVQYRRYNSHHKITHINVEY